MSDIKFSGSFDLISHEFSDKKFTHIAETYMYSIVKVNSCLQDTNYIKTTSMEDEMNF